MFPNFVEEDAASAARVQLIVVTVLVAEYEYFLCGLVLQEADEVSKVAISRQENKFAELVTVGVLHSLHDDGDVDFCLKVLAAGFRNLWTPYAELYHHESASRGKEDTLEKRDRFRSEVEYMRATWGELLDNDPAYNPNLTLTINDFTLALPPREWPPLK